MNDELSRKLRDEAIAGSPEFSPELHERTMRELRRASVRQMTEGDRSPWRTPLAAAAAVLLVVALGWFLTPRPEQAGALVQAGQPVPPLITVRAPSPEALIQTSDPLADAISKTYAAPLGEFAQDARSLAAFMARQIPLINQGSRTDRQL